MSKLSVEQIREIVEQRLPQKRFIHSCGVAECAEELCKLYGADPEKGYLAGLVHDIAKYTKPHEIEEYVNRYEIYLDELEERSLALSHGILGAYVARNVLGIEDEDILNAIKYHTTAKPDMTLLEKIIFTADLCEKNRTFATVGELRELAYGGKLDEAIIFAIDHTITHVIKKGHANHPRSVEARNYIILEMKDREKEMKGEDV